MWPHAERMLRFEARLRDGADIDTVKRYRVAIRRLRAALRLFGPAFPDRRVRVLRGALGELGRAAGAARDLDVRIADLQRWAAEQDPPATEGVAPLSTFFAGERDAAMNDLLARLATRRHGKLLRDLVALIDGDVPTSRAGAVAVRDSIGSRLWRAYENLRVAGSSISSADTEALHAIRIEAKRLRYGLEFLGDVLGDHRGWLIDRLVALQDHLGALNDAVVASAAVRAARADPSSGVEADGHSVIDRYLADRAREFDALRRDVDQPWQPIASATFARRLAATIATA
jgi:CHAD domain-containing protein